MTKSTRCLYNSNIETFLDKDKEAILGILCERYHGDALTTTREAWIGEIKILQEQLSYWKRKKTKKIRMKINGKQKQ